MQLDPKKFALLTATIATSVTVVATTVTGCTIESTGSGDNSSGGSSSSSSGDPGSSSSSSGGSSSSSSSSGSTDAGTDSGSDAGSCLGGGEAIPASECTVTDATTCSGDTYYTGLCGGPRRAFVPAVAKQAIDCLKTTPICESDEADACLTDAIDEACEDAGAEAFCRQLAADAECPVVDGELPFTLANCVHIVNALNTEGRALLTECFQDSAGATCTDEDVGYCFSSYPYAYFED